MTEVNIFIRQAHGLQPADDGAREALAGVAIGTLVSVKVSRPRNLAHMRLYWQLCSTLADSIGVKRENISDVLKLKTGHFVVIQTKTERYKLPRSISFSKLDQAGFNQFYKECIVVVCSEFLPHMTPSELTQQIEQIVGIGAEVR